MKLVDVKRSYLYEGLDNSSKKSMLLWESAGRAIAEAQLTPQQITQLFQQVEKDATAAGGNRTLIGKGKDVTSAVNQAYQNLKGKVENSYTMQYFDQKYEEAAAKLKQATGGDQGVMQYVEKYRTFAKAHPLAQSLIYSALIAAAGFSGAGAGGAAALGLLKMTDKLLQGEKFSSAAIKGAETGAMAYGASKVGDMFRGGDSTTAQTSTTQQSTTGMQSALPTGDLIPPGILERFPPGQFEYVQNGDYYEVFDAVGNKMANFTVDSMNESQHFSTDQITALFGHVVIAEGLWDKFKTNVLGKPEEREEVKQQFKQGVAKVAGAIGQQAQRIGTNITTKITADKLQRAWKSAGSPTESSAVQQFLVSQGIDAGIVDTALKTVGAGAQDVSRLPDISKLSPEQLQQLLDLLEQPTGKQHTGGKVAGQVSQTPNAIRQRQARAAKKEMPAVFTSNRTAQQPATTQPSLTDLIRQRQSQGMTEGYADFKKKLQEAKNK